MNVNKLVLIGSLVAVVGLVLLDAPVLRLAVLVLFALLLYFGAGAGAAPAAVSLVDSWPSPLLNDIVNDLRNGLDVERQTLEQVALVAYLLAGRRERALLRRFARWLGWF